MNVIYAFKKWNSLSFVPVNKRYLGASTAKQILLPH